MTRDNDKYFNRDRISFFINSEMVNHHQLIGSQCPLVFSNHYVLYFERNRTRLSKHNSLEVFFSKNHVSLFNNFAFIIETIQTPVNKRTYFKRTKRTTNELNGANYFITFK